MRYGIDVNYQANPGVMKKSSRDRFGIGFLLSYNLNNKLLFRNKLTVDKVKAKESPYVPSRIMPRRTRMTRFMMRMEI